MKRHLKAIILLTAVMLVPLEASACAVCGTILSAASTIAGMINTSSVSIVDAIKANALQVSGEAEKQALVNQETEKANIAWQIEKEIKQKTAELKNNDYAPAPNVCNTQNIGKQLGIVDADVRARAHANSMAALNRNMRTEHPVNEANRFVDRLRVGGTAVMSADTMMAPVGSNGAPSMTYTPAQEDAAKTFSELVVNPFPSQKIPDNWEKTPQGKMYVASQMAEQSRLSIADYSMAQTRAMYTAQPGLGTRICQSWTQLAGMTSTSGNAAESVPCTLPPDASMAAVMNFMAESRMSPVWTRNITRSGPGGVSRENASMMAFKLWMDYKSYLQQERMESILAAQLAIDAKAAMQPGMAAQRAAAARAAGAGNAGAQAAP